MANKTDLDARIKIDNAATTLTDITSYLTSASVRGALDIIEDTALNNEERSYVAGKAGATIPLAGMVNSTTDGILGPLIGNRTSITKTVEFRAYSTNSTGNAGQFFNGEVFLTNIEYSGSLNSLQTFSADCTFDGAINVTSAAL
jgi:hypothetical protein